MYFSILIYELHRSSACSAKPEYISELKKYSDSIEKQKVPAPHLNVLGKIELKDDGKKRFK